MNLVDRQSRSHRVETTINRPLDYPEKARITSEKKNIFSGYSSWTFNNDDLRKKKGNL